MQISEIKKILVSLAVTITSFFLFPSFESIAFNGAVPVPLLPDAGVAEASTTPAVATTTPAVIQKSTTISKPTTLTIPSLGMKNPIIGVGTNSRGEMDVPSGATQNVGWYEYGTLPGTVGSAVIDAHVFAAFSKISKLVPGSILYVTDDSGAKLAFKVEEVETYALADVPADKLFNRNDGQPRLNLITCAGHLTPDHSTYDHRFVAYAVLVH